MNPFYVNIKSASTAACTTILFLCSSATLHAEEDKLFFTLTAIEDASFGEHVVAGNYDTAIKGILSSGKSYRAGFEAQTNLCVAYTRSGDFENAGESCDAALTALKSRHRSSVSSGLAPFESRRTKERFLALALSNRGVLRAISGKPDLARKDFTEAASLKFGLDVADVNLAKLSAEDASNAAPDSVLTDT